MLDPILTCTRCLDLCSVQIGFGVSVGSYIDLYKMSGLVFSTDRIWG